MILPTQNFTAITGGIQFIADFFHNGAYGGAANVQVSTNGGTTWASVYTVPANAAWQDNLTASLNSYIGMSGVMIAVLYNDNAQWGSGLAVDNIRLNQTAAATDAALSAASPREYTLMPQAQTSALPVSATVSNVGTTAIATASVTTKIYLSPNFTTPVQTLLGTATAVAAGASSNVTMGTFTPAGTGGYLFEHVVSVTGDANASNDTLFYGLTVTDSTYARDDASGAAAIGVNNQGNTAILGNVFEARANQTLSSVLFATNGVGVGPAVGDTTQVLVYATTAGVPTGTPVATSAFYIYGAADTGAVVRTIAINGSTGLALTAGNKYFIGLKEFSRTGNLGTIVSTNIFTPNTTFASINGGAWTPLETFGFPNPALLRANLRTNCTLASTASSTNATCTATNGSATVTPTGGTAPLTYAWSNGGNTATINNVAAGTYTVTVTDASSCVSTASVTVSTTSTTVTATTNTTDSNCGGATGTATATPTAGTAPYTYAWSNGGNTSTITNVSAGSYAVTITDANGCMGTVSGIVVGNPGAPTASISNQNNVSCNGGANGSATVTATGGTSPFNYAWSNGGSNATETGLMANVYTVTITDANSCAASTSLTITQPSAITVTGNAVATMNVSCNGGNDGIAGVTVAGGTSPYTYAWSPAGGTSANATGLMAGTYNVVVTDANSCTQNMNVTITEPAAALSAPATAMDAACNGGNDGMASVTAAGGTAPYSYTWSNGAITASATGLTAGTYMVTVVDANSCSVVSSAVTVAEPAAISTVLTATDASTAGGSDGSVGTNLSGGTAPYTFMWSNGATTADITGIPAGTYDVTITDANGCTDMQSATVLDGPISVGVTNGNININVFPNPAADNAILSIELANMTDVNVTITNVVGQVMNSMNAANVTNNQFTLNMSDWAAGVYFVRVTAGEDTVTYRLTKK